MKTNLLKLKKVLSLALFVLLLSMFGDLQMHAENNIFDGAGGNRDMPVVTTAAVTKIGDNVISGGNVIYDGGSAITARGICYGSIPDPDLSSTYTHTVNGTGTGSFTSIISSANGTIYVRAYATNANGTAYGNQVTMNIDYLSLPTFEYNGLTYTVAPDPQPNYTDYVNFNSANSYCNNLTAYGYSDWRMPNKSELLMMWQLRESIGGFVQGDTYNPILYHHLSGQIIWVNGNSINNSTLSSNGYKVESSGGYTYTFRCHVRPIRVQVVLPTVTTNSVTNISQTTATCGGYVTNDGGASVTERGICWSTNRFPTIYNSHSNTGSGVGNYTINIYDLMPGTQYYVRAYAINSEGIAYGDEVSFITTSAPTVTTNDVTSITTTSAICGGNVISEGSGTVTSRGICWSTNHNPVPGGYTSYSNNEGSGLGSFSSNLTGLTPNTTYYVRAYATNSEGTAYGEEISFTTTVPPTVTTNNVADITYNSATCGGNVTNEGSGVVIARGVCWSTGHNPTISDNYTVDGTGAGNYTSYITDLSYGTTYYVRAYATNSEGTSYGNEKSFTTAYMHSVTTKDVSYITQTSATCGGYVTNLGNASITARGVCWSSSNQTPTINDSFTSNGTGVGGFSSNLTGLTQNTTYYVRAYATSSGSTVYGETKQFTTTKLSYRISEGGVVATSAGGYFYDSGGPNNEYGRNEHYIMTFTSNQGTGTKIRMTFTEFNVSGREPDYLVIYDGMNTSAPEIGTYCDWSPGTVTATNADGALTFVFISGSDYFVGDGWKAAISIVTPSYFIDVSANPGNGGTVSGGGGFDNGENCTLTATPASGYTFVKWTKNGTQVSTNPTYTFTVTESASYVAHFTANTYNIVTTVNPSVGGTVTGGGTYNYGANCTLTAMPNLGYSFVNWTDNGIPVSTNATYTFNVTGNRTLVANFQLQSQSYAINVTANPTSGGTVTGGGSYTQGSYCTLTATANSGYSFVNWTENGDVVSTEVTYSFYVTGTRLLVANFNENIVAGNIVFDDANVKTICVSNWDTNGDGELSYSEAASVTDLNQVFMNNNTITSFNELQYFTGLNSIGVKDFYYCKNLISVIFPSTITSIGSQAFYACDKLVLATLPTSIITIGQYAFAFCSALTSVEIPAVTTYIYNDAYYYCYGLDQVIVDEDNATYDSRNNCNALIETGTNKLIFGCKNAIIPNTVTAIGTKAFYACRGLTSIEIPNSVVSIESSAFSNCNNLVSINIPNSVTSIGYSAFDYTAIASLEIPSSVVSIGIPIVSSCGNLTQITVNDANPVYDTRGNCNAIIETNSNKLIAGCKSTVIPNTVSIIGTRAFYSCSGISSIEIPVSVTVIEQYAFAFSSQLTSVVIPSLASTIEDYAFYYCSGLSTLTSLAHNPPTLGNNAFKNVDKTIPVYVPYGSTTNYLSTLGWNEFTNYNELEIQSYSITASANPTVGGMVVGDGNYSQGASCTLTATPSLGYLFTNWTKDGTQVSTDATYTFIVTEDADYVANFAANVYTITAVANPTDGGTVTGSGSYIQGELCTLTATATDGYSFINWTDNSVEVSTSIVYSFSVSGERTLVANFEPSAGVTNHWIPESAAYSDNMALNGVVQIDGVEQYSDMLEVGAFCGNECRGAAIATWFSLTQRYIITMTVYGETGHQLTFKLFDHSIGEELNMTSPATIDFDVDGYGTPVSPYVLNFTSPLLTQTTSLVSGWNWYSTYIEQNGADGLALLENSLGANGLRIQGRNSYIEQFEYQGSYYWYGTLNNITNEQMYKIRTNAACNAVMEGYLASSEDHPITINNGWTWIGYPLNQNTSVANAFANFTPEADDVIKGRNGYATYIVYGTTTMWYGTLNTLDPGKGYMYKSNSTTAKSLVFQTGAKADAVANITPENNIFVPNDTEFADNMLVTAVINIKGEELRSEEYELAAFVNDECRGSVKLMYVEPLDRYVAFLLVFGEEAESISFVLTDGGETMMSSDRMVYASDAIIGTLGEPATLHFGYTGIDNNDAMSVQVYPNPTKDVLNVNCEGLRKVEVINAFGQVVTVKEANGDNIRIDLGDNAAGAYMVRIFTENGLINRQIVKN